MTALPKEIQNVCTEAIDTCVRRHRKVKLEQVTTRALSELHDSKFELYTPPSMILHWRHQAVKEEIRRQFKLALSEEEAEALVGKVPKAMRMSLHGLSRMICISPDGVWVPTLDATPDEWASNEAMKYRIAEMTEEESKRSRRIRNGLQKIGAHNLRELMGSPVMAAAE